jgi:hypothetical protein
MGLMKNANAENDDGNRKDPKRQALGGKTFSIHVILKIQFRFVTDNIAVYVGRFEVREHFS